MILDSRNEFCDAIALNTGAAGSYLLGSQIDLGAAPAPGPMGATQGLYLVILASTGIKAAGAGTISFSLASDATAVIDPATATVHATTRAHVTSTTSDVTPTGALKAGTVLAVLEVPPGFDYERYLGVFQTTGTSAITGGAIDAFLTNDPARWAAFDSPKHL